MTPTTHEQKIAARDALTAAIRHGILIRPARCSRCNQPHRKIHGHHEDYSKPLDIEWLCATCHNRHHRAGSTPRARTLPQVRIHDAEWRHIEARHREAVDAEPEATRSALTLSGWLRRLWLGPGAPPDAPKFAARLSEKQKHDGPRGGRAEVLPQVRVTADQYDRIAERWFRAREARPAWARPGFTLSEWLRRVALGDEINPDLPHAPAA